MSPVLSRQQRKISVQKIIKSINIKYGAPTFLEMNRTKSQCTLRQFECPMTSEAQQLQRTPHTLPPISARLFLDLFLGWNGYTNTERLRPQVFQKVLSKTKLRYLTQCPSMIITVWANGNYQSLKLTSAPSKAIDAARTHSKPMQCTHCAQTVNTHATISASGDPIINFASTSHIQQASGNNKSALSEPYLGYCGSRPDHVVMPSYQDYLSCI